MICVGGRECAVESTGFVPELRQRNVCGSDLQTILTGTVATILYRLPAVFWTPRGRFERAIKAEVRRVASLEANPAATSAQRANFVGLNHFHPSVPVSLTIDEIGKVMWPLPASHGWLLFGPYLVAMAGIYCFKALANVEGSANEIAYFDILTALTILQLNISMPAFRRSAPSALLAST